MSEFVEHDGEAAPGLPEDLPASERLLWRGTPDWKELARSRFHIAKLAVYFGAIFVVQQYLQFRDGLPVDERLANGAGFLAFAAIGLGLVALFARLTAGATVFSITNRRLVIRCGVAIPLTMNLPFSRIEKADLRETRDGFGDIRLTTEPGAKVSYVLLWPYARLFSLSGVQPVIRAVPNLAHVADTLGRALEANAVDSAAWSAAARPSSAEPVIPEAPEPADGGRKWQPYPTVPLAAAAGLVVLSLVGTAWIVLSEEAVESTLPQDVVSSVELRFFDQADGSVRVEDGATGQLIEVLAPGTNGFLRSTMRGMARARASAGAGEEEAFSLMMTSTGRVLLVDPVTDRTIDLWAFGPTNAQVFIDFLPRSSEPTVRNAPDAGSDIGENVSAAVSLPKEETGR